MEIKNIDKPFDWSRELVSKVNKMDIVSGEGRGGKKAIGRFQDKYNNYYWMRLPCYKLVKLEMKEDSTWYYFLTRPVANLQVFQRGVVGTFKLKSGSLKPYDFKEVVNTPHLKEAEVLERGAFLFRELKNNGKLDEYMVMKDYIQWPDSTLRYNDTISRWVPTHKL